MAFSGTSTFEKFLSIDDIITESYERLGFFDYSGNDLRSARRSLNIMFQEWDNRGLHFWEVGRTAISLVANQNEYTIFRSPSDGDADGITTTLVAGMTSTATTAVISSAKNMNPSGKIRINNEVISYSSIDTSGTPALNGLVRGVDVPEGHYEEENMKDTVVPNRNKMFSSIIQAVALSVANAKDCSVGI